MRAGGPVRRRGIGEVAERRLRWGAGGEARGCGGGEAEVGEDLGDHLGVGEEREDAAPSAAARAPQNFDPPRALEKGGPIESACRGGNGRPLLASAEQDVGAVDADGGDLGKLDDGVAGLGIGSEAAMVAHHVDVRSGNQRDQTAQEVGRREDEVRWRAGAGATGAVADTAVGKELDAVGRERGPQ